MAFTFDWSKKLGRGLKSLLGEPDDDGLATAVLPAEAPAPGDSSAFLPTAEPVGERILEVAPEAIRPNPFQPRSDFDEEGLTELAESMKTCGILSPLLVRKSADGLELIAGERRLRAAKRAGLEKVPVCIRQVTDAEALEQALVENLQRRDLNPMEKARAFREYLQMHNLTQGEAEKRLGMSRSEVANHIRLLKLVPAVQEAVWNNAISYGHARALVAVEDPVAQTELSKRIIAEQLSVRQLEELLKAPAPTSPADVAAPTPAATPKPRSPQIRELEDEFSQALGVKVTIKAGKKANTGSVVIPYASLDDFDRIREAICGASNKR